MTLIDNRSSIEADLDKLVIKLDTNILEYDSVIESSSGCQQTNNDERFNLVTFFFIHNAFAAICELRSSIKSRSMISNMLITRHLMELYSDFKFLISEPTKQKQFANAFYYFGEMRNIELNKYSSEAEKFKILEKWKEYSVGNHNRHWSGKPRTEIVKEAWRDNMTVYSSLSAHCHPSLLTQDLVFWTYSDRTYTFISANVDGCMGMVDEILEIAKSMKLCGCISE